MKPLLIPVLVGLLCAYSVCFANEPLTYFEVKIAVHVNPHMTDPDLSLFVVSPNIRMVNLGIFQGLNGRNGIIAKRVLGSDPLQIAPYYSIEKPMLLSDWFHEPESRNIYIRLSGTETETLKTLQILHHTSATLILGDDVQMTFEEETYNGNTGRKYIVETGTQNAFIKTKNERYRLREVIHNCERFLNKI